MLPRCHVINYASATDKKTDEIYSENEVEFINNVSTRAEQDSFTLQTHVDIILLYS